MQLVDINQDLKGLKAKLTGFIYKACIRRPI